MLLDTIHEALIESMPNLHISRCSTFNETFDDTFLITRNSSSVFARVIINDNILSVCTNGHSYSAVEILRHSQSGNNYSLCFDLNDPDSITKFMEFMERIKW